MGKGPIANHLTVSECVCCEELESLSPVGQSFDLINEQ